MVAEKQGVWEAKENEINKVHKSVSHRSFTPDLV